MTRLYIIPHDSQFIVLLADEQACLQLDDPTGVDPEEIIVSAKLIDTLPIIITINDDGRIVV